MTPRLLTGSQRKTLRGLAHDLRPAVQIGRSGLTDTVVAALEDALLANELIKVQIAADRDERRQIADTISTSTGAECVGTIGRMAIFFREHPEVDKRQIKLA